MWPFLLSPVRERSIQGPTVTLGPTGPRFSPSVVPRRERGRRSPRLLTCSPRRFPATMPTGGGEHAQPVGEGSRATPARALRGADRRRRPAPSRYRPGGVAALRRTRRGVGPAAVPPQPRHVPAVHPLHRPLQLLVAAALARPGRAGAGAVAGGRGPA